jgi:hypothetical protein
MCARGDAELATCQSPMAHPHLSALSDNSCILASLRCAFCSHIALKHYCSEMGLRKAVLFLFVSIVSADDALIQWLRNNNGVFSEKVHFRHLDPTDDTSPNGLFAKEDLEKGETVMVIPRKCLFTTQPPKNLCRTARELANHRRQGEKSSFKEYVNYLFDGNKRGMLPGAWSPDAKKIMGEIKGAELPDPIVEQSFKNICGDGGALEQEAFDYVISRSWGEVMIPVYDMVNHRVRSRTVLCWT